MPTTVEPIKLSTSIPTTTPPHDPLPKYLQEDEMTQERKDLVSSLPTEKGWVANYLHQYQEEEASGLVDGILKLCSFDTLSNLEVNKTGKLPSGEENKAFFRRGEIGDWKDYLTCEMIQEMDKITEEKLHALGLKF
ncbi:hypothetical protein QYF36_021364 [Acer negundo]|nr:hypothetical protein QYF36_021364 [Acer negundo]